VKKTKKTVKVTKKTQKKVKETYLSHFHLENRLGLTVCSRRVPGTDIYCLGMSLVHEGDMGSRKKGREMAFNRCVQGLEEFAKNQEICNFPIDTPKGIRKWIKKVLRTEQPVIQNLLTDVTAAGVIGQSGHWLVKGLEDTKKLVVWLRKVELFSEPCEPADAYHQVFFRLPTVSL
jgi:hypothetical protein